jgi:hypothetical protein
MLLFFLDLLHIYWEQFLPIVFPGFLWVCLAYPQVGMGHYLFCMVNMAVVDVVVVDTTLLLYLLNMFSVPCLCPILVHFQDHLVVGVVMQGFEMVLVHGILYI